jgi:hypothetical protein
LGQEAEAVAVLADEVEFKLQRPLPDAADVSNAARQIIWFASAQMQRQRKQPTYYMPSLAVDVELA